MDNRTLPAMSSGQWPGNQINKTQNTFCPIPEFKCIFNFVKIKNKNIFSS